MSLICGKNILKSYYNFSTVTKYQTVFEEKLSAFSFGDLYYHMDSLYIMDAICTLRHIRRIIGEDTATILVCSASLLHPTVVMHCYTE